MKTIDLTQLAVLVTKTEDTKGLTILVKNEELDDLLVLNKGRVILLSPVCIPKIEENFITGFDVFSSDTEWMNYSIDSIKEIDGPDTTYEFVKEYQL